MLFCACPGWREPFDRNACVRLRGRTGAEDMLDVSAVWLYGLFFLPALLGLRAFFPKRANTSPYYFVVPTFAFTVPAGLRASWRHLYCPILAYINLPACVPVQRKPSTTGFVGRTSAGIFPPPLYHLCVMAQANIRPSRCLRLPATQ